MRQKYLSQPITPLNLFFSNLYPSHPQQYPLPSMSPPHPFPSLSIPLLIHTGTPQLINLNFTWKETCRTYAPTIHVLATIQAITSRIPFLKEFLGFGLTKGLPPPPHFSCILFTYHPILQLSAINNFPVRTMAHFLCLWRSGVLRKRCFFLML